MATDFRNPRTSVEPEADEADVPFLHQADHSVCLSIPPSPCPPVLRSSLRNPLVCYGSTRTARRMPMSTVSGSSGRWRRTGTGTGRALSDTTSPDPASQPSTPRAGRPDRPGPGALLLVTPSLRRLLLRPAPPTTRPTTCWSNPGRRRRAACGTNSSTSTGRR